MPTISLPPIGEMLKDPIKYKLNADEWETLRYSLPGRESEMVLHSDKYKSKKLIVKYRISGYMDELIPSTVYWVIKGEKITVHTDLNEAIREYSTY